MSIIEALINGIVQGLTEFLPVSSSGHLGLLQYFTGRGEETGLFFTILLHLGTLLAVFLAFWKTISGLITEMFLLLGDIFRGKFRLHTESPRRKMLYLLFVSLLPMGLSFFLLDFFEAVSTDNDIVLEGFCFLLTSLLLFLCAQKGRGRKKAATMTYKDALLIGGMQAIAPIPGISRSGSTVAVGMLAGLDREFAIAFSFIMGVPTVLGANILQIGDAMQTGLTVSIPVLITGVIASLIFGLLAIRLVRWLAASDKFRWFAWYTLVLGVLTVIIGIVENVAGHPLQQWVSGLVQ